MKLPKGEMVTLSTYGAAAISPDGRTIAFVVNGHLMKRGIDQFESKEIQGTEDGSSPFFSPDSRWLGYFADGKLKKALVSGGPSVVVADGASRNNRGATWAGNGQIIYSPGAMTGLWTISENGGSAKQITFVDSMRGERTHRWPSVLPDGKTVLFTVGTLNNTDFYEDATIDAVDCETGARNQILKKASTAKYAGNGYIAYTNAGTLYAAAFDDATRELLSTPIPVIQGINGDPTSGAMAYDISRDGTLTYVPGENEGYANALYEIDMDGKSVPLEMPLGSYIDPKISPDGRHIALVSIKARENDIVVYDVDRHTLSTITFGGINRTPVWSPDSKRIMFCSNQSEITESKYFIIEKNADGSGHGDTLMNSPARCYLNSWSKDGQYLIMEEVTKSSDIGVLNLKGEKAHWMFSITPFCREFMSTLSPDGKYLAYVSNELGMHQVYVQTFPDKTGKWQISADPGREPKWSPDGKKLYFSSRGRMMVADLISSQPFMMSQPRIQYEGDRRISAENSTSYDIMIDGKHFVSLLSTNTTLQERVNVIVNWTAELNHIARTGR